MFSFQTIFDNLPVLIGAARYTLLISVLGCAQGLLVGAVVCAGALSRRVWLRRAAALYVSFFRGVPLLIQLLVAFYLLPVIGINVPALVAAVLTVGLCAAAYLSEVLRGALNAIPRGQAEAAAAIGMAPRDLWLRILLPQALKIGLPAIINELILLVKASSLVTVVGIVEITRMSQSIASATYRPLEIYLAAAFLYLAINLVIAQAGRLLERRLAY
ncbi:amino acid ABC transporter permease [Sinirhodobacter ferrireducens]|uniref:Amino acid ABC transporter permease n=1 Tax=Paenirhodobacter ferrireducens TaxID=1215032 RepID=A0A443LAR8_9RHOB|nr:amino acid ABC transporter permease [Sinirhodobacter ferrireducens]RWR46279.1 amino acid ABC transporter permease [Sinirhodobacter ferrireducens]